MKRLRPSNPAVALSLLVLVACRSSGSSGGDPTYQVPTSATGPVLFSPGFVSIGLGERDAAFTLDGNVFAFTQMDGREGTIVLMVENALEIAPFSGEHSDLEPFFDPRGGVLWFVSNRPHPDDPSRSDHNIWRVTKTENEWGEPEIVRGLDGSGDEFYPTVALDGTLAFTAEREGGFGGEDIWLAAPDATGSWRVENAGPGVNGPGSEFNALITPDGRMLIFSSTRTEEPGDQGGGDLYASTRRVDGAADLEPEAADPGSETGAPREIFFTLEAGTETTFGDATLLAPYNSPALDYCPAVTPNGRYLVFTSRRRIERPAQTEETIKTLRIRLLGPGNGRDDLWWAVMPSIRDTP